ncbi:MAG: hypothetical protein LBL91_00280 [Lachnospiraceae bacterium]|jgi:hypothetical protein|nr:hypothetical protein [Lachnospiraceae bacterium]
MKEIIEWFDLLKTEKDKNKIKKIVEEFDLSSYISSNEDMKNLLELAYNNILNMDIQYVPYILDSLYVSENKGKFYLFCYLLEKTYERLPFITNLEQYSIHREKFKMFLPTLIEVASNTMNGICDCMFLILLKFVQDKDLFTNEQIEKLTQIIEEQLAIITQYLKNNEFNLNEMQENSLNILLDVSSNFFNKAITYQTIFIMSFIKSNSVRLWAAISLIKNNIDLKESVLEDIAADITLVSDLLRLLEKNNCINKFPEKFKNQEIIAKSILIKWLMYPTELGKVPNEIELIETIEKEGYLYYIYKFSTDIEVYKDKNWMLGISGGFKKEDFTAQNTGITFSKFETVTQDFLKQGNELIEFIMNYWKERAKKL